MNGHTEKNAFLPGTRHNTQWHTICKSVSVFNSQDTHLFVTVSVAK